MILIFRFDITVYQNIFQKAADLETAEMSYRDVIKGPNQNYRLVFVQILKKMKEINAIQALSTVNKSVISSNAFRVPFKVNSTSFLNCILVWASLRST